MLSGRTLKRISRGRSRASKTACKKIEGLEDKLRKLRKTSTLKMNESQSSQPITRLKHSKPDMKGAITEYGKSECRALIHTHSFINMSRKTVS